MHLNRRLTHTSRRLATRLAVLALAPTLALVGGVAFAQWLANGTGAAYAKAQHAVPLRTSEVSASETLYPGGTGDVSLTIVNDNPFPVTVHSITADGAITSGIAECDDPDNGVTFTDQAGTWDVDGHGSTPVTLTGAVAMAATSPDACQGATFTIPVSLSSTQGASSPPPAALQLSPTSKSYGGILIGQSSATTFTVTNTGAPTTVAPTVATASPAFPIVSNTCTGSLATGATCAVGVAFAPNTRGAQTATLTVAAAGSTASASLSGTGLAPAQLTAQPSLGFPTVLLGQSATNAFTVTNTGDAPTGVPAVSISGPNAGDFTIVGNGCTASLPGLSQCQVTIRFAPTATGPRVATAMVAASPGGTVTVSLNGSGSFF